MTTERRSAGVSLFRTRGDVGMLVGSRLLVGDEALAEPMDPRWSLESEGAGPRVDAVAADPYSAKGSLYLFSGGRVALAWVPEGVDQLSALPPIEFHPLRMTWSLEAAMKELEESGATINGHYFRHVLRVENALTVPEYTSESFPKAGLGEEAWLRHVRAHEESYREAMRASGDEIAKLKAARWDRYHEEGYAHGVQLAHARAGLALLAWDDLRKSVVKVADSLYRSAPAVTLAEWVELVEEREAWFRKVVESGREPRDSVRHHARAALDFLRHWGWDAALAIAIERLEHRSRSLWKPVVRQCERYRQVYLESAGDGGGEPEALPEKLQVALGIRRAQLQGLEDFDASVVPDDKALQRQRVLLEFWRTYPYRPGAGGGAVPVLPPERIDAAARAVSPGRENLITLFAGHMFLDFRPPARTAMSGGGDLVGCGPIADYDPRIPPYFHDGIEAATQVEADGGGAGGLLLVKGGRGVLLDADPNRAPVSVTDPFGAG